MAGFVSHRCVAAVVAEKYQECVFGLAYGVEMIHEIAETLVHPFYQSGECRCVDRIFIGGIVVDKTLVDVKRCMYGVMGQIEIERFALVYGFVYFARRFNGKRIGKEGLGVMVFVEVGHGASFPAFVLAVAVFRQIAGRMTDSRTCYVDVKPEIARIAAVGVHVGEMSFSDMDCLVAVFTEYSRVSDAA